MNQETRFLPILICERGVGFIPFPMTEDDFDLMIAMLNLWKRKIVYKRARNDGPFVPQVPLLVG
jgi:hypothetical protein